MALIPCLSLAEKTLGSLTRLARTRDMPRLAPPQASAPLRLSSLRRVLQPFKAESAADILQALDRGQYLLDSLRYTDSGRKTREQCSL